VQDQGNRARRVGTNFRSQLRKAHGKSLGMELAQIVGLRCESPRVFVHAGEQIAALSRRKLWRAREPGQQRLLIGALRFCGSRHDATRQRVRLQAQRGNQGLRSDRSSSGAVRH